MPHGDIEQGIRKRKERMRRRFIEESSASIWPPALSGSPGWDPSLGGQGGAISCLDHRLDDAFGGKGGLVVLHIHGVGYQADLRPAYALQLVHRLFHMGGACGAGHTGDVNFCFKGNTSFQRRAPPWAPQRPAAEAAQIRSGANAIHPLGGVSSA